MDPLKHSKNSVHRFGGIESDYLNHHRFLDTSKRFLPDFRHRLFLHNTMGIFLGEELLGKEFKNSDGKWVSTRQILEQHVSEDLLRIPTVEEIVSHLSIKDKRILNFSSRVLGVTKYVKKLLDLGKITTKEIIE